MTREGFRAGTLSHPRSRIAGAFGAGTLSHPRSRAAGAFGALLKSLGDAWRDRRYEEAVSHFAPDIRYVDPLRYSISGRDALLAFFRNDGGYPQDTTWHHVLFDEATQIGAAEYSYRGTHLYHGVVLIRLEDDRITHWREYQHMSGLDWESFFKGAAF